MMGGQPVGVDHRLGRMVDAVGRGPFGVVAVRVDVEALQGGVRVETAQERLPHVIAAAGLDRARGFGIRRRPVGQRHEARRGGAAPVLEVGDLAGGLTADDLVPQGALPGRRARRVEPAEPLALGLEQGGGADEVHAQPVPLMKDALAGALLADIGKQGGGKRAVLVPHLVDGVLLDPTADEAGARLLVVDEAVELAGLGAGAGGGVGVFGEDGTVLGAAHGEAVLARGAGGLAGRDAFLAGLGPCLPVLCESSCRRLTRGLRIVFGHATLHASEGRIRVGFGRPAPAIPPPSAPAKRPGRIAGVHGVQSVRRPVVARRLVP